MKLKNKIFQAISLVIIMLSFSCKDDFFDVNKNPNNPSTSSPRLTLPVAEEDLVSLNSTTMTYLGQYIMGNWATPSNWNANVELIGYNITSTFYSSIFEDSYASIFKNLTYIENYKDPKNLVDYSFYKNVANILKAYQYQYLVDLYGNVPYTEANQREVNVTPKYDKAEEIYKSLIEKLTNVVTALENLPENAENPKDQDIIFKGDIQKWQQFANTIKLRYLIRLSNTNEQSYIQTEFQKILDNGKGFITDNVLVDPGYIDTKYKLRPFYGYFKQPSTKKAKDRYEYTVASEYTLNYLTDTNDPRLSRLYAEAEKGGYKGVEQKTILPGKGYTTNDLSGVGEGLIKEPTQGQVLMLLSEVYLLQAEAVERGYLSGDAESLYNKAITESFKYLEVEDYEAKAEAYYTQQIPNVSYSFSTDKIQAIITQKWIVLNGTSSIESWLEYNRTGYPNSIPIPEESGRDVRPYRLLYPASEISTNSINVPKQTKEDAFTKKIFWQKK